MSCQRLRDSGPQGPLFFSAIREDDLLAAEGMRRSGIDIIGDVPWGTHFCQFYWTKEDLTEILVPYFKAGLENNEFCMWVPSEPLSGQEAETALRKALPDLDHYLSKGQIEIIPHSEWYLKEGLFDAERVLNGWVEKLNHAQAKGFDGLRLTGNTFWLEKARWRDFVAYEEAVESVIGRYRIIAICTYSLDRCTAMEAIDVVKNHQFALTRRDGQWELIESSERRRAAASLRESEVRYRSLFDNMTSGFALHRIEVDNEGNPIDYVFLTVNPAFERLTGLQGAEIIGKRVTEVLPDIENDLNGWIGVYGKVALTGEAVRFEQYSASLGRWYSVSAYSQMRGHFVTIFDDITERRKMEEAIRDSESFHRELIEALPVAVYTTDAAGRIRLYNEAAVAFWGRRPEIGQDRWCGSSRLYWPDGRHIPHEGCPMAVAVNENRPIRGVEGVAERPDGTRLSFIPYPTPLRDSSGALVGAINVMVDITERRRAEERADLLARTAAALLKSESPQSVVDHFCREVMDFLGCHVFFNFLADGETGRLRLNACAGIPEEEARRIEWLDYGAAVCGCAARDGCRIVAENISSTPDPRTDLVKSYGIEAYACHPLTVQGRVLGTLSFGTGDRSSFSEEELSMMQAVADLVAIAMQRKQAEETIEKARLEALRDKNALEAVMEALPVGLAIVDVHGGRISSNRAFEEIWGGPTPEPRSVKDYSSYSACWVESGLPVEPEEWASARAVQKGETVIGQLMRIVRFDGGHAFVHNSAAPIFDAHGVIAGSAVAIMDITGRMEAEEALRGAFEELEMRVRERTEELRKAKADLEMRVRERTAELLDIKDDLEVEILARREKEEQIAKALQEKETLLRELYHRTKNNMNVISGLITLQTASLRDDRSLQMFRDLQGRITSMSLVHQKLYQAGDLSNVSLRDYVDDLAKELLNSYRTTSGKVALKLDIESFSLSIDAIIPCGLVLNELMANSLKYAFPEGQGGVIRIEGRISADGEIAIRYSDNGIGLPEGFDLHKTKTLGLKLVTKLTEGQLGGKVQLRGGQEPEFLLRFREPHYLRRI